MEKTPRSAKNSLKFKAGQKAGIVSVKIGGKKFVVPVQTRLLSNETFAFVSFPAVSELYKIEGKTLSVVESASDAAEAHRQLDRPTAKKKGRGRRATELPSEVSAVLQKLPAGTKLVAAPDGSYRLVRTRKRR